MTGNKGQITAGSFLHGEMFIKVIYLASIHRRRRQHVGKLAVDARRRLLALLLIALCRQLDAAENERRSAPTINEAQTCRLIF